MIQHWHQKPKLRGGLFLGGNLLVAVLFVNAVVWPARDFFAERDAQIADQGETLARWRAIAAQDSAVRTMATQVSMDEVEFLSGKSEGVIQAELQSRLKSMVEKAGARLRSIRSLQTQVDQTAKYLGSRVELFGPIQTVHRAMDAIETAKPYLFIKGAILRPSPTSGPTGSTQEPTIEAQLDIFGVMRPGATP